jgi:hypothetical protein
LIGLSTIEFFNHSHGKARAKQKHGRWLTFSMCQRMNFLSACALAGLIFIFVLFGDVQFLREELHYEGGHERRQKAFHRDDDMHISVRELWDIWTRSEVHNWTIEQTTEWLSHFVQLPQYVSQFQQHNIDGAKLPR